MVSHEAKKGTENDLRKCYSQVPIMDIILCKNTLFQNPQKWYMTQFWRTDASIWAWMIAIAMLSFIANCSANHKSQDMILQQKHVAA